MSDSEQNFYFEQEEVATVEESEEDSQDIELATDEENHDGIVEEEEVEQEQEQDEEAEDEDQKDEDEEDEEEENEEVEEVAGEAPASIGEEPAPSRRRRRHPRPPIPVIGNIEEAEASLLYGIITGNEVAVAVVQGALDEMLNNGTLDLAAVGTNVLMDLAARATRNARAALESIISQFVGLYKYFWLCQELKIC